jgi:hypothetical protein
MTTADDNPTFGPWRTSSYSHGGDNCVQMAYAEGSDITGIGDSKNPTQRPLTYPRQRWLAFLTKVGSEDNQ